MAHVVSLVVSAPKPILQGELISRVLVKRGHLRAERVYIPRRAAFVPHRRWDAVLKKFTKRHFPGLWFSGALSDKQRPVGLAPGLTVQRVKEGIGRGFRDETGGVQRLHDLVKRSAIFLEDVQRSNILKLAHVPALLGRIYADAPELPDLIHDRGLGFLRGVEFQVGFLEDIRVLPRYRIGDVLVGQ